MSHSHFTKLAKNTILLQIDAFHGELDYLQREGEMDVGEEAVSRVGVILEILKNEVNLISVEEKK